MFLMFSFLMFCSLNAALTSKLICASKENMLLSNSNAPSKGVQKNMLKTWDFT